MTVNQNLYSHIIRISSALLLLWSLDLKAQNLVLNGDFESYNNCPAGASTVSNDPTFTNFRYLKYWIIPTSGSSDYYNKCAAATTQFSVPTNAAGYQQPHSGGGYAGLYGVVKADINADIAQEFISTKLPAPLKKDSMYCVSFYASPTIIQHFRATHIAANSIGALISDALPTTIPKPSSDPSRFILNDSNIHLTDTALWYKISGLYRAKGSEQWVTIGVFFNNPMPPFSFLTQGSAYTFVNYFYIDDVSVKPLITKFPVRKIQYCGVPVRLMAAAATGPYRWSTGDTGNSIMVSAPGSYTCTTPGDCTDMLDPIEVVAVPISDTVTEKTVMVCSHGGLSLKLSAHMQGIQYKWSNGETTRDITVRTTGVYMCQVVNNCRSFLLKINVVDGTPAPPVLRDTTVCQYTVSPVLQTGYDDLLWFDGKGSGPYGSQPPLRTLEPGLQVHYASRKVGECTSARTPINVLIRSLPRRQAPLHVLRCSDRSNDQKIGLKTEAGDSYIWSTGDTSIQIPLPAVDGQYTRSITNTCGTSVDTFNLSSGICNDCIVFPNAFTPNKDGVNDGFRGLVRCDVTAYLLRIYNRWGEMIFVSSKPEIGWDGTQHGIPALMGTYMYQCTMQNKTSGDVIRSQGDVLLIR